MEEKKTQDDLFSELASIKEQISKEGKTTYRKCPVCKAYINIEETTTCPCGKATYLEADKKWVLKEKEEKKETNEEKERREKERREKAEAEAEDNTISGLF